MQLDGALWHTAGEVEDFFNEQKIPYIISAPYSYDGAVAELFFALFKQGEVNPTGLKMTKSKYLFLH